MFVLGINEIGRVEIADGSLAISAEFPAPVFGPRMARPAPVAPATTASWDLTAGQAFAFTWSHPQDLVGVTLDDVVVHLKHGYEYYGVQLTVTEVTETEIRGTIPTSPDYTGEGVMEIGILKGSSTWDPATSCTGATECTVTSYRWYEQQPRRCGSRKLRQATRGPPLVTHLRSPERLLLAERVLAVAGTAAQVAARVGRLVRVARHRRRERAAVRGSRCSPCRCRTSCSRTGRR